jgi:hypothetical protein
VTMCTSAQVSTFLQRSSVAVVEVPLDPGSPLFGDVRVVMMLGCSVGAIQYCHCILVLWR